MLLNSRRDLFHVGTFFVQALATGFVNEGKLAVAGERFAFTCTTGGPRTGRGKTGSGP